MEQLMSFVSDVGFPIIVTLYLLQRIEAKLDTLNDTIIALPDRLREGYKLELEKKIAMGDKSIAIFSILGY